MFGINVPHSLLQFLLLVFLLKLSTCTVTYSLEEVVKCRKFCEADGCIKPCKNSTGPRKHLSAFYAILTKSVTANNAVLKFDKVITDLDDSYKTSTGKFVAPRAGTYRFDWFFMSKKGSTGYLCGMMNGNLIQHTAIHGEASQHGMGSGFMILEMKKGDEVFIQACHYNSYIHVTWWRSVFIGEENLVTMYPGEDRRASASKLANKCQVCTSTDKYSLKQIAQCRRFCPAAGYTKPCDNKTANKGAVLKFDKVITGLDNSYKASTGKFVAPRAGIYRSDWSFMSKRGSTGYLCGMLNGNLIQHTAIHGEASQHGMGSGFMILEMKKGDKAFIQVCYNNSYVHHYSSFFAGQQLL